MMANASRGGCLRQPDRHAGNIQRRAASSIFPVKSDGVPVSNQTTIINHAISDRAERILIPSYPSPIRLNQCCSSIDGLFLSVSLNTESNQLQGTDDSETSRQSDEPPIGRRFFRAYPVDADTHHG